MRLIKYYISILVLILTLINPTLLALSSSDLESILKKTPYYEPESSDCSISSGTEPIISGSDLDTAEKIGAFNGPQITPTAIIVHWTAGEYDTPQQFVNQLKSSTVDDSAGNKYPNGRAVQLTIDKEGKVYQLTDTLETRPLQTVPDQTWNDVSIGIEIESGTFPSDKAPYPLYEKDLLENETQFNAVASVVSALVKKYNISTTPNLATKSGIFGHFEIAPADKSDPGPTYLQKVKDSVSTGAVTTQTTSSAKGCSCSENSNFVGSDNAEIAYNFFRSAGFTNEQAAGIVGNLNHESGLIPNRKQGSGMQTISSADEIKKNVGFGIAQWTTEGRQQNWIKFAADQVPAADPLSLELQLKYLLHELETTPSYGLAELKAAGNDVIQATWIFLAFFERPSTVVKAGLAAVSTQPTSGPAKETLDERAQTAQSILQSYGTTVPTSTNGCTLSLNTETPDYSKRPDIKVDGSPPGAFKESNCSGDFTVGAASLKQFIIDNWSPPVSSVGGYACRAIVGEEELSLHGLGRALDIMVDSTTPEGLETGDKIRNFLINNAEVLGLQRVIWNRMTWSANKDGWRTYSGDNAHTDHLHVEINIEASQNSNLAGVSQ